MRFAAHFADAPFIDNANASAIATEDSPGKINALPFWRKKIGSRVFQFDAAPVAIEAFFQNLRVAGRANSPADGLPTMRTFHD
jgi:hypothetical protein